MASKPYTVRADDTAITIDIDLYSGSPKFIYAALLLSGVDPQRLSLNTPGDVRNAAENFTLKIEDMTPEQFDDIYARAVAVSEKLTACGSLGFNMQIAFPEPRYSVSESQSVGKPVIKVMCPLLTYAAMEPPLDKDHPLVARMQASGLGATVSSKKYAAFLDINLVAGEDLIAKIDQAIDPLMTLTASARPIGRTL
jgi:hypothetical protein